VALSNIVRGAWQNCTVGYYVDQTRNGRGYATEALGLATGFALTQAGLHRVQAGVMPRNAASIRVVEKNGFRFEGLARHYLQINGVWEDHNIYALTAENWPR
jgi:[ribosomal protein S5]-alanine N-acetyltransferase